MNQAVSPDAAEEDEAEGSLPRTADNPNIANPARVYDALLGGKDNFAADRAVADKLAAPKPALRPNVRANRAYLGRVVRYLATEAGIRQFLDLGTGLPSHDNTHEGAPRPTRGSCTWTTTRSSSPTPARCSSTAPPRARRPTCRPRSATRRRSSSRRRRPSTPASRSPSCCSGCCT